MRKVFDERCYGIVPLRRGVGECLMVQLRSGSHWGFPKGHAEHDEEPLECAKRELYEETGLTVVQLLSSVGWQEEYVIQREGVMRQKVVTYFIAEVEGQERLQADELLAMEWVAVERVKEKITYPSLVSCWGQVYGWLQTKADFD